MWVGREPVRFADLQKHEGLLKNVQGRVTNLWDAFRSKTAGEFSLISDGYEIKYFNEKVDDGRVGFSARSVLHDVTDLISSTTPRTERALARSILDLRFPSQQT